MKFQGDISAGNCNGIPEKNLNESMKGFMREYMYEFLKEPLNKLLNASLNKFLNNFIVDCIEESLVEFLRESSKEFLHESMEDFLKESLEKFLKKFRLSVRISEKTAGDISKENPCLILWRNSWSNYRRNSRKIWFLIILEGIYKRIYWARNLYKTFQSNHLRNFLRVCKGISKGIPGIFSGKQNW